MNQNNTEYEKGKSLPISSMNEESKQKMAPFSSFLKLFSISILLFLIMSYISNKYIPGLFMNYIPMFFPVGKLFCKNLKFVSIFHSPLEKYEDKTSNKFFEKETIDILR
jgi:cadmium resistance protein CadD (predicted permease)